MSFLPTNFYHLTSHPFKNHQKSSKISDQSIPINHPPILNPFVFQATQVNEIVDGSCDALVIPGYLRTLQKVYTNIYPQKVS